VVLDRGGTPAGRTCRQPRLRPRNIIAGILLPSDVGDLHPGVLTPEDAFVAAAGRCVMLMFVWAAERFRVRLLSYECHTEGTKVVELDRTEIFTRLLLPPTIRVDAGGEAPPVVEARARKTLLAAEKYSLVANSVKSEIVVEPTIVVAESRPAGTP
jgi:uncharacterized OsmC-like protein